MWIERKIDSGEVDALTALGYHPLLARIMALRGVSPATVDDYLNPRLTALLPPSALPGVESAAATIVETLFAGRKIVIFGDYDCDGVSATALMVRALRALNPTCPVVGFLPERRLEGYGMSEASVARMLLMHADVALIVTVDNGINSIKQVADLKARGIEVVVTDHHLPGEELPDCIVVNPKCSPSGPYADLCGAGVAFLVVNAVADIAKRRGLYTGVSICAPLLVLAGMATITDIMPLSSQNRILVSQALRLFPEFAPVGLKALFKISQRPDRPRQLSTIVARDFGYILGPRINAAGRISSGMEALELMLYSDADSRQAEAAAVEIDGYNTKRKEIETQMIAEARSQIVPGAAAQVVYLPNGDSGVAGIVASRLLEESGRAVPVAVVAGDHGSARAPSCYNVRDAFVASTAALKHFGGHAAAGGFSVKDGAIEEFRRLFTQACGKQSAKMGERSLAYEVDAVVEPQAMTLEFVEMLSKLEPFGEGNPEPMFVLKGVMFSQITILDKKGKHLQFGFYGYKPPRAFWWNHGDKLDALRAEAAKPHDVVFKPVVSDFRERHVDLHVVAVELSGS